MERVLVECDRAEAGFEADPVHDLRVALRRCRSLADGLMAMDPDSSWKEMKKAGKKLFQSLGELRDVHVMQEWVEKLSDKSDPVAAALIAHLQTREAEAKQHAFRELQDFDRKQWRQWARMLPGRMVRVRPGSVVFKHLALEKWTAAYDVHKRALRSRSQIALHELRIGIKRFRYTVENFLPRQHAEWGSDLKELQDLLGEVHDLDVLWTTLLQIHPFPDPESKERWHHKLLEERAKRTDRYREKMVGRESLWQRWRADLPAGPELRAAAVQRLSVWASYLDPDFAHSQRVAKLALTLFDALSRNGILKAQEGTDVRPILQAAALAHDVGRAKADGSHHKASFRKIRKLEPPLGWSPQELEMAAVVARYHRGVLPRPRRSDLQRFDLAGRRTVIQLAAVLRFANALDLEKAETPHLDLELRDGAVLVRISGYAPLDRAAEKIAAARHLLEIVLRKPVLVRGLPMASAASRIPAAKARARA